MDNETLYRLSSIFEPFWTKHRDFIIKSRIRFVHYTSAENAMKIIQTKSMWMRNARCMNDYNEISHGYKLLVELFGESDIKQSFVNAIDGFHQGLMQTVFENFNAWWLNIQSNTFICSISEHDDSEDEHGRLSMWRAYGQKSAKAAIVLNIPFEPQNATKSLSIFLRPAIYFTKDLLRKEINRIISNIKENSGFLSTLEPQIIASKVFLWLLITTVCLKHEGFKEEREWRVIYLPQINPSKFISGDIETILGVPQLVYKIPLKDIPEEDIVGTSIPQLINRIIIGPTDYPYPLSNAFILELHKADVKDASSRVIVSAIPLRT